MVVVNEARRDRCPRRVQGDSSSANHRDELLDEQVKKIIRKGPPKRLVADWPGAAGRCAAQQIGTGIELDRAGEGTGASF